LSAGYDDWQEAGLAMDQGLVLLGAWLELAVVVSVLGFWILRGRGGS